MGAGEGWPEVGWGSGEGVVPGEAGPSVISVLASGDSALIPRRWWIAKEKSSQPRNFLEKKAPGDVQDSQLGFAPSDPAPFAATSSAAYSSWLLFLVPSASCTLGDISMSGIGLSAGMTKSAGCSRGGEYRVLQRAGCRACVRRREGAQSIRGIHSLGSQKAG